uniref:Uncharacterized protein n=1 Tax=Rhizophora mucronata TaxID=61149 RepID=A0A2P2R2W7_RHIMU
MFVFSVLISFTTSCQFGTF